MRFTAASKGQVFHLRENQVVKEHLGLRSSSSITTSHFEETNRAYSDLSLLAATFCWCRKIGEWFNEEK
jgi:hypothetical protein